MSEIWLWMMKYAHLSAISLWAAGLVGLPFLIHRRNGLEGDDLYRLHRFCRFLYVGLVSPAAFIGVGTGIALIFMRETFVEWFSLKLVFVGLMVILHVVTGLVLLKVFADEGRFGFTRATLLTLGQIIAIVPILYFVLAKPDIGFEENEFFRPGALEALLSPLIAWVTP